MLSSCESCSESYRVRALEVSGDQARAALVADVGPRPLEHDDEAVAEADQVEDVDEAPDEPGGEPESRRPAISATAARGRSRPGCPCRSSGTARRGCRASVAADVLGGVAALLHRDRATARQRAARLVREDGEVADHEHLGVPRDGEVAVDDHAAGAVEGTPSDCRQRRGRDAGGPEDGAPRRCGRTPSATPSASTPVTAAPARTSTPRRRSVLLGARRALRRVGGEDARARLDEDDARLARVDRAEVADENVAGDLARSRRRARRRSVLRRR